MRALTRTVGRRRRVELVNLLNVVSDMTSTIRRIALLLDTRSRMIAATTLTAHALGGTNHL